MNTITLVQPRPRGGQGPNPGPDPDQPVAITGTAILLIAGLAYGAYLVYKKRKNA
jgi:hypothetical protein